MHEPPLSHNPSTFKRWIHCRDSSNRKLSAHNSAAAISNGCGVMIRRPLARTSRGGNGVSRLASAGKREHSPRRNPLWHRVIVPGEGLGFRRAQEKTPGSRISRLRGLSGGDRIRTCDLEVMSLASYRAAPPRDNVLEGWDYCWEVRGGPASGG